MTVARYGGTISFNNDNIRVEGLRLLDFPNLLSMSQVLCGVRFPPHPALSRRTAMRERQWRSTFGTAKSGGEGDFFGARPDYVS